ncbi:MAG: divergent polysaccharide deacetylase family protein [Thermoanaerobaculia bacterium]
MSRKPRPGTKPRSGKRAGKKKSRGPGCLWKLLGLAGFLVLAALLFLFWPSARRHPELPPAVSTPPARAKAPGPPGSAPRAAPAPSPREAAAPAPTPLTPLSITVAPPRENPGTAPSDFEPAVAGSRGVIALVLDDLGYDDGSLARLEAFSGPLAIAVIPSSPRAAQASALAKRKGWDLLVHLPMKAESASGEPEAIGPDDDDRTIARRVTRGLDLLPGAVGLNNHQGSRATADARVVRAMLRVVRDRGLFFLDSRTTAASVAESEARALGISTIRRDVFLDDAATEASAAGGRAEALAAAWANARAIARKKGHCVVIGHPHRETLQFLAAHLSELDGTTFERVRVSELVD